MSEEIGSTYEIIKEIGSGSGGIVYLAYHKRLKKNVILKACKSRISSRPDILRREVDTLKELRHIHIPQVHDFFTENGTVYTVMDYIEGESLDKALKRGEKFTQPQVIKWGKQLCEALEYLHSPVHGSPKRGYVHSDIKPANLMLTPQNDIYLIDFNVALALGEENAIGCSPGYASPEHYGLDYTSAGVNTLSTGNKTETLSEETKTLISSDRTNGKAVKKTVPDVRSDIYSAGATLYHLLSGEKPASDAFAVKPLSEKDFSPPLVKIITKAMSPNPELRYQTAGEMLADFQNLYKNDPRVIRLRKQNITAAVICSICFILSLTAVFIGLKRMQTVESWLKFSEYSQSASADGDISAALEYALKALPARKNLLLPGPVPEAQKALSEALGIYDISDSFKKHKILSLPGNPLFMSISPDGKNAACIYSEHLVIFDTETAEIKADLRTDKSALSEAEFLNNDIIIFSGDGGIQCYDISGNTVLWSGKPCTSISISADKKTAAAIYKDDTSAVIYDTSSGRIKAEKDFGGLYQHVAVNDIFANPADNLFEINNDGTMLAISFADGSLKIFDLTDSGSDIEIYDIDSDFTHFEGGFHKKYFAFSASEKANSVFAVIDTENCIQTGGFDSADYFGTAADESGIYVQTKNLLVKIDPESGSQTPLITTPDNVYRFDTDGNYTLAASENHIMFFGSNSVMISDFETNTTNDFVKISGNTAVTGSMNTPDIKIFKFERHPENTVFSYEPSYKHDEARISADMQTAVLFSYRQFRVYKTDGTLIKETDLPDCEHIYDQQFIRDNSGSRLEVSYYDGRVRTYSAEDGELISETVKEKPDSSLYEEFYTDKYRIESPLHGAPGVYDKDSDRFICSIDEDGYLTYITQSGDYIIAQFVTADGYFYGVLLDNNFRQIAYLPYLSDIYNNELYFNYTTGDIRKSCIYTLDELIKSAKEKVTGGL